MAMTTKRFRLFRLMGATEFTTFYVLTEPDTDTDIDHVLKHGRLNDIATWLQEHYKRLMNTKPQGEFLLEFDFTPRVSMRAVSGRGFKICAPLREEDIVALVRELGPVCNTNMILVSTL